MGAVARVSGCLVAMGLIASAWAQQPPAAAASSSARMEQVLREASRPLQMILRASRIESRPVTSANPASVGTAVPTPPVDKPTRTAASASPPPSGRSQRPAAEGVTTTITTLPAAVAADSGRADNAVIEQLSASMRAAESASAPSEPSAAPDDPVPEVPRAEERAPVTAVSPSTEALAMAPPSAALTAVAVPVAALPLPTPRLLSMVEPVIPDRLMARVTVPTRYNLQVDIQPDGSVSAVQWRSGGIKSLEPLVLDAVRQWRYAPMNQPVRQTVELVIRPPE